MTKRTIDADAILSRAKLGELIHTGCRVALHSVRKSARGAKGVGSSLGLRFKFPFYLAKPREDETPMLARRQ